MKKISAISARVGSALFIRTGWISKRGHRCAYAIQYWMRGPGTSVQKCTHLGSKETSTVFQGLAHLATTCNLRTMRYQIDGSRSAMLEEFYEEVSRVLIPGESWGRNLDAFHDDFRGGFGTPLDGFTID